MLEAIKSLVVSTAHAQLGTQQNSLGLQGTSQQTDIATLIGGIMNFFLGFVGLVAVMILIYGGFKMITSAGDQEQFGTGRQMIIYAVIGIVIIVISWTVVGALISGLESVG